MRRVFFDTDPVYNCTRIEFPSANNEFSNLPETAQDVRLVEDSEIPTDRTFRNAWKPDLTVDFQKAKVIAHEKRRAMRSSELAPLDEIIAKQIPGNNPQQVESQRQVIRDKYAAMQAAIDAAQDVAGIKSALGL